MTSAVARQRAASKLSLAMARPWLPVAAHRCLQLCRLPLGAFDCVVPQAMVQTPQQHGQEMASKAGNWRKSRSRARGTGEVLLLLASCLAVCRAVRTFLIQDIVARPPVQSCPPEGPTMDPAPCRGSKKAATPCSTMVVVHRKSRTATATLRPIMHTALQGVGSGIMRCKC